MKRILSVVIVLVCLLPAACKKKKGPASGNSVQQNNGLDTFVGMTAKIGATDFNTVSVFGYKVRYAGDTGKVNLLVTGTMNNHDTLSTITFTISDYQGVRTYLIDPPYTSATYYVGNVRHYATTGQILVTSDSDYGVIGTFNFTADTTNLTDGNFNVAKP